MSIHRQSLKEDGNLVAWADLHGLYCIATQSMIRCPDSLVHLSTMSNISTNLFLFTNWGNHCCLFCIVWGRREQWWRRCGSQIKHEQCSLKKNNPPLALLLSTSLSVVEFKERAQRTWSANPAILFQHRIVLCTVSPRKMNLKWSLPVWEGLALEMVCSCWLMHFEI